MLVFLFVFPTELEKCIWHAYSFCFLHSTHDFVQMSYICPANLSGAYLNTIKRTVKYLCPADIVPPYIDVDLSELDVGQKLVRGDLKVHPALRLLQSAQEPVCKIMGSRVSQEQKKSK